MTSLRWLEATYPHYVPRSSRMDGNARLSAALAAMSLFEAERQVEIDARVPKGKFKSLDPKVAREGMLENWNLASHNKMRSFLEAGGYPELLKELSLARKMPPIDILTMDGIEEEVRVRMNGDGSVDDLVDSVVASADAELSAKRKQESDKLAAERQLEDLVREHSNPTAGSW